MNLNSKYDDARVDCILKDLKNIKPVSVPEGFTASVMDRIGTDASESVFSSVDSLFWKFSIAASFVAAASLAVAFNIFSSFTPELAEFAAVNFLNVTIF